MRFKNGGENEYEFQKTKSDWALMGFWIRFVGCSKAFLKDSSLVL